LQQSKADLTHCLAQRYRGLSAVKPSKVSW